MDSLLVNLRKYRPRENTDPLENFITEAFAWLLKSSEEVQRAIFNHINGLLESPVSLSFGDIQISTQENFNGKFPDMVVSWPDCSWVFEHKVWTGLHKNQLKNYRSYIAENSNDYRIILITAKRYQFGQNPDAALCWEDIFKKLFDLEKYTSDERLAWALADFLALLKSEGLGPSTPINRFAITHYLEALKFDEQVNSVFQAAQHKSWPLQSINFEPVFKRQKTESRVGLEFCPAHPEHGRQWLPGLFCGVIICGVDHGVSEFLNEQLNLCIVFDFNRLGQNQIKQSSIYVEFKEALKSNVEQEFADWQLIDTEVEPQAKLNRWHPLILIRSMITVFESTTSHEEQVEVFHQIMSEFQQQLLKMKEFELLVKTLAAAL